MSSILDQVDQRTNIVGVNRLEILMFQLHGKQRYGINVFKVQEVMQRPHLSSIPMSHPAICGVATVRKKTIPVIDLSMAIGQQPLINEPNTNVIITEYNRATQGFLVRSVDRIINMMWENVIPPPAGVGEENYLSAISKYEDQLIEMIDVEKILGIVGCHPEHHVYTVSKEILDTIKSDQKWLVLVVDDSSVARSQLIRVLQEMRIDVDVCHNGQEALKTLKKWADEENSALDRLLMIISDIEMPSMDGYTLTREIRRDDRLKKHHVMLHSSLSGNFNVNLINSVGANGFIAKFSTDDLSKYISNQIKLREAALESKG